MTDTEKQKLRVLAFFQFLEPTGKCHVMEGDAKLYFPDTIPAKWILSLLVSNQDIGLVLKLQEPFLLINTQDKFLKQYRYSCSYYFWRLLCAHAYEAWRIFNDEQKDPVVIGIKSNAGVKKAYKQVCDKLSARLGVGKDATTVKDLLEKCRNITFHYYEEDGDKWGEYSEKFSQPLAIDMGDYDVDRRWIVADKYLDSRLALYNLQDIGLQTNLRDAVFGIVSLIRQSVEVYFAEVNAGNETETLKG